MVPLKKKLGRVTLTTPKNRAESSDVTFEEVLAIYVKGDFKECLT